VGDTMSKYGRLIYGQGLYGVNVDTTSLNATSHLETPLISTGSRVSASLTNIWVGALDPSLQLGNNNTTASANITINGNAPSFIIGSNIAINLANVGVTGAVPLIQINSLITCDFSTIANINASAISPGVAGSLKVLAPTASINILSRTPAIKTGSNINTSVASISLNYPIHIIKTACNILPPYGIINISGVAPAWISNKVIVNAPSTNIILSSLSPIFTNAYGITPLKGLVYVNGAQPSFIVGSNNITEAANINVGSQDPLISTAVNVVAGKAIINISSNSPSILTSSNIETTLTNVNVNTLIPHIGIKINIQSPSSNININTSSPSIFTKTEIKTTVTNILVNCYGASVLGSIQVIPTLGKINVSGKSSDIQYGANIVVDRAGYPRSGFNRLRYNALQSSIATHINVSAKHIYITHGIGPSSASINVSTPTPEIYCVTKIEQEAIPPNISVTTKSSQIQISANVQVNSTNIDIQGINNSEIIFGSNPIPNIANVNVHGVNPVLYCVMNIDAPNTNLTVEAFGVTPSIPVEIAVVNTNIDISGLIPSIHINALILLPTGKVSVFGRSPVIVSGFNISVPNAPIAVNTNQTIVDIKNIIEALNGNISINSLAPSVEVGINILQVPAEVRVKARETIVGIGCNIQVPTGGVLLLINVLAPTLLIGVNALAPSIATAGPIPAEMVDNTDIFEYRPDLRYILQDINTIDNISDDKFEIVKPYIRNGPSIIISKLLTLRQNVKDVKDMIDDQLRDVAIHFDASQLDDITKEKLAVYKDSYKLLDNNLLTFSLIKDVSASSGYQNIVDYWEDWHAGEEGKISAEVYQYAINTDVAINDILQVIEKAVVYNISDINDVVSIRKKELLQAEEYLILIDRLEKARKKANIKEISAIKKQMDLLEHVLSYRMNMSNMVTNAVLSMTSITDRMKAYIDPKYDQLHLEAIYTDIKQLKDSLSIDSNNYKIPLYANFKKLYDSILNIKRNQQYLLSSHVKESAKKDIIKNARAYLDIAIPTLINITYIEGGSHNSVIDSIVDGVEQIIKLYEGSTLSYKNMVESETYSTFDLVDNVCEKHKIRNIFNTIS
jgi:hypothetical protein